MNIRLIVRQGPRPGQAFELTQPVLTLGREKGNDIQIDDPKLSRHHARLTLGPTGYVLEDLGSTNGTFVNDARLTAPTPIQSGDVIRFGETVLVDVQGVSADAAQTMAAARIPPAPPPPPAYEPAPAYAPPPPPPPPPMMYESQPAGNPMRNLAIGCGVLLVLLVCVLAIGAALYFFAPPEIAAPLCDALRPVPVLGSFCQ
jgi:predicted component of type VI protein secretion system